mmetsp:Transcript_128735/g.321206  ORF Transcript_128735/g.321206 Transcript_128735/m.321206 type:complete len:225 (+) Transcript_128735:499-1173(+)
MLFVTLVLCLLVCVACRLITLLPSHNLVLALLLHYLLRQCLLLNGLLLGLFIRFLLGRRLLLSCFFDGRCLLPLLRIDRLLLGRCLLIGHLVFLFLGSCVLLCLFLPQDRLVEIRPSNWIVRWAHRPLGDPRDHLICLWLALLLRLRRGLRFRGSICFGVASAILVLAAPILPRLGPSCLPLVVQDVAVIERRWCRQLDRCNRRHLDRCNRRNHNSCHRRPTVW